MGEPLPIDPAFNREFFQQIPTAQSMLLWNYRCRDRPNSLSFRSQGGFMGEVTC